MINKIFLSKITYTPIIQSIIILLALLFIGILIIKPIIILFTIIIAIFIYLLKFPEIWLALTLTIGTFQASLNVNTNFTLILCCITILSFTIIKIGYEKIYLLKGLSKKSVSFLLLFIFFLIIMFFSLFYTPGQYYGITKLLTFSFLVFPTTIIAYFLFYNKKDLSRLKRFYFVLLMLAIIMTFGVYFFQTTSGFSGTYLGSGRIIGLGSIILTCYLFNYRKHYNLILFTMLILNIFALLITAARMPIISFIICFVIILCFKIKNQKNKIPILLLSLFTIIVFSIIIINNYEYFNLLFIRFEAISNVFRSETNRGFLFLAAINMILDNPLFGNGLGSYHYIVTGSDWSKFSISGSTYPHNIILEAFCELGLIGVTLLLLMIISPLKKMYSILINFPTITDEFNILLITFITFIFVLLNSLISGTLPTEYLLFTLIAISIKITNEYYSKIKIHDKNKNLYNNNRSSTI